MVTKVISGGQIGADIAGLKAAQALGIKTGGFLPKGWETKDGPKPEYAELYGMEELLVEGYAARTKINVIYSQGTMRFARNWNSRGELATLRELKKFKKPYHDVDIEMLEIFFEKEMNRAAWWIQKNKIGILNIAGNAIKDIEPIVQEFLEAILL